VITPGELAALLEARGIKGKEDLHRMKMELVLAGRFATVPSDGALLALLPEDVRDRWRPILRVKPVRTRSGVAVIAAMTAPEACPHGTCTFCPGGPSWGTPQSYTGKEPAAMRGAHHAFDPFAQVSARIEQLRRNGHDTDKVDLIIEGGTFTAHAPEYQESFVKGCFDAMNGSVSPTLEAAHTANETAGSRVIGMTVETKPDCFLDPAVVERTLWLGTTRVELGIESTYDAVLAATNRGHTDADSRRATRAAKEAGLKVCYHMMPGLPETTRAMDEENFRRIFEDPDYRPDMLKIYPTVVVPRTALHRQWRLGKYSPPDVEAVVDLLAAVKARVPPWVRIQRIQREINAQDIDAGPKKGNVRELVGERMAASGARCRCIRCREVGSRGGDGDLDLRRTEYEASGGTEVFLSMEDRGDTVYGYARLRLGESRAILRELKVYGQVVPIGEGPGKTQWQHRGLGAQLLRDCEGIVHGVGRDALFVTSGVGVRGYYRRFGYEPEGPYLVKRPPVQE